MLAPSVIVARSAKDPNVFATIMFLPNAAMNRIKPDAIWLINNSSRYCLNILQKGDLQ